MISRRWLIGGPQAIDWMCWPGLSKPMRQSFPKELTDPVDAIEFQMDQKGRTVAVSL
jgi:hypothetical protein